MNLLYTIGYRTSLLERKKEVVKLILVISAPTQESIVITTKEAKKRPYVD